MSERLGYVAYESYLLASGGVSLVSGAVLPSWDDQDVRIQEAWNQAADAVRDRVRETEDM